MPVDTLTQIDDPEELNAEMQPRDLVDILSKLKFPGNSRATVRLDRHVCRYIVDAITARCGGK
jgi:hypothetical protein